MADEVPTGSPHAITNASRFRTQFWIVHKFFDVAHAIGPLAESLASDRSAGRADTGPVEHLLETTEIRTA